jgi:DNA-directed RNA polymerase subunit RPC12/RpoP
MNCWHCSNQLEFDSQATDASKLYHCADCDKWYELKKEKERVNGAVPVRFMELESSPNL